jgi:hypothetical protein
MIEILETDRPHVVHVRIIDGLTRSDYDKLYELLSEKTMEHGHVHLHSETVDFGLSGLLSMWNGIVPDLRFHDRIKLDRVAVLGDDLGARLSTLMWRKLNPVWPLHAHDIRFFGTDDRDSALQWIREPVPERRAAE